MKMRSRRRTHHSHVAWSGSDEEFQSQTPQPAWDAAWDRVRAERKQAGLPNAYFPKVGWAPVRRSLKMRSLHGRILIMELSRLNWTLAEKASFISSWLSPVD